VPQLQIQLKFQVKACHLFSCLCVSPGVNLTLAQASFLIKCSTPCSFALCNVLAVS